LLLANAKNCFVIHHSSFVISLSFVILAANISLNVSMPSAFTAEVGTILILGNLARKALRFSSAFGKSILFAMTNHGRAESVGS
jgi:hypothetical protein